jgi:membrane protease YdiL (CAAX protease family)
VWLAAVLVYWTWAIFCRVVAPESLAGALHTQIVGRPALGLVIVVSAANAVFEEFLWLALGVAALQRCGLGIAAIVSIGLRTLVHVYQGPLALVAILPLGTVFTVYYVRTRRIWPVVIAHGLQDLLSLGLIASGVAGRGGV